MTKEKCKAITAQGNQCNLKPDESGYCHIHNPVKIAARQAIQIEAEENRKKAWAKGKELREVIDLVEKVCEAKGWSFCVTNRDWDNWKYATVAVERNIPSGNRYENITGIFDISIDDDGVKFLKQKTSFYGHGLDDLLDAIMNELGRLPWLHSKKQTTPDKPTSAFQKAENIIKKFNQVARQIRHRYANRETLIIQDEYDVQDLIHSILKISFDDIRPEEHTPSYAGASSRMDFLLKKEKIVIEAKMASNKLTDKVIGEQLLIDISRYQSHPDCKRLICFVYDPDGFIRNPIALENDLSGKHNDLDVNVLVVPQ